MILTPNLDYNHKEPIYMQLYAYVVEEIRANRLEAGVRMPSVRKLAGYLNISRNSVENAYNQLLAEGYIISLERKGYFVAQVIHSPGERAAASRTNLDQKARVEYRYDFKSEYVSSDNFDYRMWKKHLNYILNYENQKLYEYGEVRGETELRKSIADHFYRTRGMVAGEGNIVIGGGISPLLSILVKLLDYLGHESVGMEDPGFNKAKGIFAYSHMKTRPIPVSNEGLSVEALYESDATVCYVSPSHQFPTGMIMPVGKRQQLLSWAEEVDGYIIEDDYNAELRFEGKPIPAMQGMDRSDRVIYMGSFSTVLAPAIRVSFMVLPYSLNQVYEEHLALFSQSASKLEQLAMTELIRSGDFEKHIRRIRKNYARKQENVIRYLKAYLPDGVLIRYGKSGLMITLVLPEGISARRVIEACKSESALLDSIDAYRFGHDEGSDDQLILSYRGIDSDIIEEGIRLVAEVIGQLMSTEGGTTDTEAMQMRYISREGETEDE